MRVLAALETEWQRVTLADYPADFRQDWHRHDETILTLVVSGHAREQVGRAEAVIAPLQIGIKPAGLRHTDHFGPVPLRAFRVAFSRPVEGSGFEGKVFGKWSWQPAPAAIRALLRAADHLVRHAAAAVIEGDIVDAVAALELGKIRYSPSAPPGWLMQAREQLVDENGRPTLAVLARAADVHPVYFAEQFRRFFGQSVGATRQALKAHRAMAMVLGTNEPLAVIAHRAGYADQAHMSRQLGRELGVAPSRLRRLAYADAPSKRSRPLAAITLP